MRCKLVAFVTLLPCCWAVAEPANGQGRVSQPQTPVGQEVRCADCHTCPNPTRESPCLAPCPRPTAAKGPDVVLLDQLSSQYVPVVFAHKLHAQMTEMTGGCSLCHHFNPSHRILRCRECHTTSNSEELAKPGLKGAYHRQCLNCHREWSHETECSVCHAKKTADSVPVVLPDPTDIMGKLHPNIEEPIVKTYETTYEHGKQVIFRHQEHVQRFGFKCVNCHHEESCSRCHQPENATLQAKTLKEHHAPCSSCHETNGNQPAHCVHCHSDGEIPPFSHAQVGLVLNEVHQDAACSDCHLGSKFHEKPACSECHEAPEKITYPEKLPGKKVETP